MVFNLYNLGSKNWVMAPVVKFLTVVKHEVLGSSPRTFIESQA